MNALDRFDHDSYWTALATLVSYGLVLAAMTVVLFLVPYAVFSGL
jgi:hypothetical protein